MLACAAVATLMGSSGYQAFEDTCKKFTQRQLKALGCQQDPGGRYAAPSESTFLRGLTRLDAAPDEAIAGAADKLKRSLDHALSRLNGR